MTPLTVLEVVDGCVISRGFVQAGKDGYEELTGLDTTRGYVRDRIDVSVGLDEPDHVTLRVSEDASEFGTDAMLIFDELLRSLERRWPGKVEVIP